MAHRQFVLAVFPDEAAADSAAVALKDSGIADGDAIGILALDAEDIDRRREPEHRAHGDGEERADGHGQSAAASGKTASTSCRCAIGPSLRLGVEARKGAGSNCPAKATLPHHPAGMKSGGEKLPAPRAVPQGSLTTPPSRSSAARTSSRRTPRVAGTL